MTYPNPSDAADVLALRLVMAFSQRDLEAINHALADIRVAIDDNPRIRMLVLCSLAIRLAKVYEVIGEAFGNPDYALDQVTNGLLQALDRDAS